MNTMDLELNDKVAVITGPAKGMGAAISLGFAREGTHLALIGRDVAAIEPVCKQAKELGVQAEVLFCDVTSSQSVDEAVAGVLASFGGRVDILINVARGHRSAWKDRSRDHPRGVRRYSTPECFGPLQPYTCRCAGHESQWWRQDRQRRRHLRYARAGDAFILLQLKMGTARHDQELCARTWVGQYQRQSCSTGNGRWAPVPR